MKFKVGDKVVRLPKYRKDAAGMIPTVSTIKKLLGGGACLLEESSNPSQHWNLAYFELEEIYYSPLCKALR